MSYSHLHMCYSMKSVSPAVWNQPACNLLHWSHHPSLVSMSPSGHYSLQIMMTIDPDHLLLTLHLLLLSLLTHLLLAWQCLCLLLPHVHNVNAMCFIGLVMCMVMTNTWLSKWRRLSADHAGVTSSGNPDCLTGWNHKCLAIFPAPPLHFLLTLLHLPPLLIARMTLNGYAMKGKLNWLHFWCQRQSPYRPFLQKPSLFTNGHTGTFLSYLLQHKRNGKPHVNTSLIYSTSVISHSFVLAISGPLTQLHILKTWTLEHSHSEHYSRSPDLHHVPSFPSPFWFIYIHTSYCFIHSSDPVPSCVHHSGLQVPGAQPQYVVTWLQTFSNLYCSITNPMYSLLVSKLIVQLLYSLASLSI